MSDKLQTLPHETILRAKHIVSHLLLPDNARVLDLGCAGGALTAACALLVPHVHFIGIERNAKMLNRAEARFKDWGLDNLSFQAADPTKPEFDNESVDAIIASRLLGRIYSQAHYDDAPISTMLEKSYNALKKEGILLLDDYITPAQDELEQIEFPIPIHNPRQLRLYGHAPARTQGQREIELLQWFSQNARAHDSVKGFYLEEITPRRPFTRLFLLPASWAYEFALRKLDIRNFKNDPAHINACLSAHDYERLLAKTLGARINYSAPWRQAFISRTHFEGAFKLYSADGTPRPLPTAGHIIVAQKMPQGAPLKVQELRPTKITPDSLHIQSVRNEQNGAITDVVSRLTSATNIIPYFIENKRLKVILSAEADMGLANVNPRACHNLDGKIWSGYTIAPHSFSQDDLEGFEHASLGAVARLMIQKMGLTPEHGKHFEAGPKGYPAPDMIDELSKTLFINVRKPDLDGPRLAGPLESLHLKTYDSADILRATGAGYIPNAWLDIQIQALRQKYGFKVTPWLHEAVPLSHDAPPADHLLRADEILAQKQPNESKNTSKNNNWGKKAGIFRPIRGQTGQISTNKSAFACQTHTKGTIRATTSFDADFATPTPNMINIAAILPLTLDFQGNTLVGFELNELPVPSRFGQTEPMMNLPTCALPTHITNMDDARTYIAEQFDVDPEYVAPMGESFFTYISLMPQRVYPFSLSRPPYNPKRPLRFTTLDHIRDITDLDTTDSFLWKWGLAYAHLCQKGARESSWAPRQEAQKRVFGPANPKWMSASASWHKTSAGNDIAKAPTVPKRRHRHD